MYSPAFSHSLRLHNMRKGQRMAACSSSVVLPLMPRWFDHAAAWVVGSSALIAIAAAAVMRVA